MNTINTETHEITRAASKRTDLELKTANERDIRSNESGFGAFVVYAWAAVGLFALSIASVSLLDPFTGGSETTYVAGLEQENLEEQIVTSNPITTASVKKTAKDGFGSKQEIVNIYPRSFSQESKPFSFGAQIGTPTDIDGLVVMYSVLEERSPQLLHELNPLVKFQDRHLEVTATLIAGPFETKNASAAFCEEIRSKVLLDCRQASYEGDPLLAN